MPEPACCTEVRHQLARHGLPAARVERIVEELRDHWTELHDGARQEGVAAKEASAQADLGLGTPRRLTEGFVSSLRRSSWFGEHPILTLAWLPLLLAPLLMAALVAPFWLLDEWIRFSSAEAADATRRSYFIAGLLNTIHWTTLMAAPLWLCRRLWRAGLGLRWVTAAGVCCLLFALVRSFDANPLSRSVTFSLTFPWRLNLQTAGIVLFHLAVISAYYLPALPAFRRMSPQPQKQPPSAL